MRTRDGGTRDGASTTGRPGRLQWTDTALVEAPAERVWELLISTIGDTAVDDRHVRIDRSARRLVVEGDWWFRGVYSVEPHEWGTLHGPGIWGILDRLAPVPGDARGWGFRTLLRAAAALSARTKGWS